MTHICVSKLTIIGSDNGLSPDRRQAIIWTNAGILLIGPVGTNFSEILIEILTFSFKKLRLKVSSAKRRPFCLGLNVLSRRPCFIDIYLNFLCLLRMKICLLLYFWEWLCFQKTPVIFIYIVKHIPFLLLITEPRRLSGHASLCAPLEI